MESAKKSLYQFRLAALLRVALTIATIMFFGVESAKSDAATASSAGTLHGMTSQGFPGYIKTSSDGVFVERALIPVEVKCSFGPLVLPEKFELVPILPSGRFKETVEGSNVEEGVSVRVFESLSGRFNRQRTRVVTKTRIYLSAHAPDGSTETCDSGVVTMHAHK
jgi:hypothetical protein